MQRILLLAALLVFISGCGYSAQVDMSKKTPSVSKTAITSPEQLPAESFVLQEKEQDALFYIATGFSGGMGSSPLIEKMTGKVKKFNDLPIYLEEARVDEVLKKGNMPSCVEGKPFVAVNATITLKKETGVNTSIQDAPTASYYVAKVKTVKDVIILAKPCKE